MKKFLILFLTMNILIPSAFALDFDLSIDEDIRRNYNPSKIDDDAALPVLPNILTNPAEIKEMPVATLSTKKSTIQNATIQKKLDTIIQPVPNNFEGSHATLKAGTKINAKLMANISDRSKKGFKIKFISRYPVSTTYYTIPKGTVFHGEVVDSHMPQLTGNGGLIVIKVDSMTVNDSIQPINATITRAHSKKIFFNNIKGKRRYINNVAKSIRPGTRFFSKMMGVTSRLANDGSSIIIVPFSITAGLIGFGANTIISPVLALFSKGDPIYIHGGSDFEIKLQEDVIIYN